MANIPRNQIIYDDSYFHLTWQCHNNQFYFKNDYFKQYYYDLLLRHKEEYEVKIYAYCFMSSHIHLAGYCKTQENLSNFVRVVNSSFAKHFNRLNKRKGQVCMDRFKSPLISDEEHLQRVINYIELNPIRAKMVKHPSLYKFSSFSHYAFGKKDPLITDSPSYIILGETDKECQIKYVSLIEEILKNDEEKYRKNNYSSILFIGNPEWVKVKYDELKKQLQLNKKSINKKTKGPP